ncbi:NAD(P)-dependent oxidoreductase [Ureibacillus chungkukjangi]|uniref:Phosphoglycerate dehydrogenase-like enzyme n=1 Tax=Ureibacillus chungkukjangi TaxID=1202712 RepID=A0A318TET7_9BACL|nr:NAD(P)-dependent oxidoreductase [Ureibacillus chungkukjangi]MCM3388482.1 D-2-hydroxyacid dehydrogenase [Ureibacillus chungkukjangi]PYF03224.1 phosphoglycerate dehydrogenase-like enzyme [Ureibacillus chungkukjangi]
MRVYFTFDSRPDLQKQLVDQFPEIEFAFRKGIVDNDLETAEVIVTYGEDLSAEDIAKAQNLKWIFVASAGVEKMPKEAIAQRNILVSNVRGIHKKPMTESILAHILSIKRILPTIYNNQRNKVWDKRGGRPTELNGSTALIIGPGAIGGEIGRLLQAFDVYTIGCNRSGNPAEYMNETFRMDEISEHLPKTDIVISVLPSTKETEHLIKYEHFQLMKDNAIFMNFGRGNLVETSVLIRALEEQQIQHAVLDVFEEEPLPLESKLWELDNVTISPHCSSHSSRYLERSLEIFIPSLEKYLAGDTNIENKMNILRGY